MRVVVKDLFSSECPQVVDNLRRACTVFLKIRNIPALINNKKAARATVYMRELRSPTQPRLHRAKETRKRLLST